MYNYNILHEIDYMNKHDYIIYYSYIIIFFINYNKKYLFFFIVYIIIFIKKTKIYLQNAGQFILIKLNQHSSIIYILKNIQ